MYWIHYSEVFEYISCNHEHTAFHKYKKVFFGDNKKRFRCGYEENDDDENDIDDVGDNGDRYNQETQSNGWGKVW